jgi:hypothetical protein
LVSGAAPSGLPASAGFAALGGVSVADPEPGVWAGTMNVSASAEARNNEGLRIGGESPSCEATVGRRLVVCAAACNAGAM